MQGPIDNALMLVAAGNAWLRGASIGAFWPDSPTFRFLKFCEFRTPPSSGRDEEEFPLRAADPSAWFASLKPWCKGLRLHCVPRPRLQNQQLDTPDRMLVGFVGGGPRWLIEAVGKQTSEVWEGFFRGGDRKDADQKIWLCTYILQGEIDVQHSEPADLSVALSDLRLVLPEITAYARAERLEMFADRFVAAAKLLGDVDAPRIEADAVGFDHRQTRVLEAIRQAWVFGGMGSWNDVGGGDVYDTLSERLFHALNDVIAGLANDTFSC